MQLIKKSALFALVLSSALICGQQVQAAKPSAAPAQETTLEVKAKLDAFAKSYVARANDTLKNNRQNMSVTKQGKGYVARYTEVDASTMTTEIYPGKGPGCEYVGHIVYLEKVYECTGKTISEANALDRRNQVNRVFRVALVTFVILGSISSLVMFVFAQPLANLQGDSLAAPAVRVMALSCFFVCTMSAYRGYAQGHSDMVPTAVSQVLEALTKLGVGLVLKGAALLPGVTI